MRRIIIQPTQNSFRETVAQCFFSRPSYIVTLIETCMSLTDSKHNGNSMGSTHKHDMSITGPSQCPDHIFCSITAEGK